MVTTQTVGFAEAKTNGREPTDRSRSILRRSLCGIDYEVGDKNFLWFIWTQFIAQRRRQRGTEVIAPREGEVIKPGQTCRVNPHAEYGNRRVGSTPLINILAHNNDASLRVYLRVNREPPIWRNTKSRIANRWAFFDRSYAA
jgi:hypothetical protein